MNRTTRRSATALTLALVLGGLAGCQHLAAINKGGGITPKVTTITLQMPDAGDPDGVRFAQDVAYDSHGSLKVDIDTTSYPSIDPGYGARLVAAMRAGTVGFSYDPARDWAAAGVPGFKALQAFFLLTTVSVSEKLANSRFASEVLRGLSGVGMVGIGLIPTQPRQILSTCPLFSLADFNGERVRIINNPQTSLLFTALGAQPVPSVTAGQLVSLLQSRSIGAVETSATAIESNSYNAEAHYLTTYAVLPKFETIVATKAAWAKLTLAQQSAFHEAATSALANAAEVPARESAQLTSLCRSGLVLDEPSAGQLTTLEQEANDGGIAVAAIHPGSSAAVMVGQIARGISGDGPRRNVLPTPPGCRVAHTVSQAKRLGRLDQYHPTQGDSGRAIPTGTYVTTDTAADFSSGNVTKPAFDKAMTVTTMLYSNWTDRQIQRPANPSLPLTSADGYYDVRGHYVVNGNQVTFFWPRFTGTTPETVRWSYFKGQLTFTIVHVQDTASVVTYIDHPWRKVG